MYREQSIRVTRALARGKGPEQVGQGQEVSLLTKWVSAHHLIMVDHHPSYGLRSVFRPISKLFYGNRPRSASGWPLLDHEEVWKRIGTDGKPVGKPVCITSHIYADRCQVEEVIAAIEKLGFAIIVRSREESWYYPGSTTLVEIWAPGESPLAQQEVSHGTAR